LTSGSVGRTIAAEPMQMRGGSMHALALAFGLVIAPLSAFATSEVFQDQMDDWIGRSRQDLVAHFWNRRDVTYAAEGYQLLSCSGTDSWVEFDFGPSITIGPHGRMLRDCEVTFTIRSGAVESWRAEGDRCVPESRSRGPQVPAQTTPPPRAQKSTGVSAERHAASDAIVLVGIPFVVTSLCLLWLRSRRSAMALAIAISEFIVLGFTAATGGPFVVFTFIGLSFIAIGCCLFVVMVAHVLSAFPTRDRVTFAACALAHLGLTISLFAWSNQWEIRMFLDAVNACMQEPPPPAGLKFIDATKHLLGMPVLPVMSALARDQIDIYPLARFLPLATINSMLIAGGCTAVIGFFRKPGRP
jgi:hypothetical protein